MALTPCEKWAFVNGANPTTASARPDDLPAVVSREMPEPGAHYKTQALVCFSGIVCIKDPCPPCRHKAAEIKWSLAQPLLPKNPESRCASCLNAISTVRQGRKRLHDGAIPSPRAACRAVVEKTTAKPGHLCRQCGQSRTSDWRVAAQARQL